MKKNKKNNPPKLKDLAERLNVSPMTVSKALRGHSDISKNTKQRVLDLAKKLNYQPNFVARNLSSKKTFTIGIIMPKIAHSFYSAILDGIQTIAEERGYEVILTVSRENVEKEKKHFLSLISMRVDGLLISVSQETNSNYFQDLERLEIPIVFFDRDIDSIEFSSVKVADKECAFFAVEHAINLGNKKIMHFAGFQNMGISRHRCEGYMEALKKHQIPIERKMIYECGFGELAGYNAFMEIYKNGDLPEVIFCVSDSVAIGVYKAAKEKNIRIGKDIGLIGFTDINEASLIEPPLTTIHEPAELMGKTAANILIDEIENKETNEIKKIMLPGKLIVRESCGESKKKG